MARETKCHHTQLAKEVCLLAISLFTLHVQTTRLKLKGTAVKFCSANSKAIQQANPTQILLSCTFAARHGGASAFIGSLQTIKKRLACQTEECARVRFATKTEP